MYLPSSYTLLRRMSDASIVDTVTSNFPELISVRLVATTPISDLQGSWQGLFIDGMALQQDDEVLLNTQENPSENGLCFGGGLRRSARQSVSGFGPGS